MEPTGIEPVSAMGIDLALVHRLSSVDPWSGDRQLSLTVGCSGEVFTRANDQRRQSGCIRWGLPGVFNGVRQRVLETYEKFFLGSNRCSFASERNDVVRIYFLF